METRKEQRKKYSGSTVALLMLFSAASSAFITVNTTNTRTTQSFAGQNIDTAPGYTLSNTTRLQIDDYIITFQPSNHSDMQGRIGYTYTAVEGDIFIDSTLSVTETYFTCVHEHMHDLGIPSDKHEVIYNWEDKVVDRLCLKAVAGKAKAVQKQKTGAVS